MAVELADLAFSLDNVVAAVALSRELWVVMTGVFLGIVTMRFAAVLFTRLIERYPVLEAAAYILVLNIGIELLLEDIFRIHISDLQKFGVSLSTLVVTLLYGGIPALQHIGRRGRWVKRALVYVDLLLIYAIRLVACVIMGLLVLIRALLGVLLAWLLGTVPP